MKKIHLQHENDRGTIPPYFWRVEIEHEDGKIEVLDPGEIRPNPGNSNTTKDNAEDMVVLFGEKLGIKDTTSEKEWAEKGFEVVIHRPDPRSFGNWPE